MTAFPEKVRTDFATVSAAKQMSALPANVENRFSAGRGSKTNARSRSRDLPETRKNGSEARSNTFMTTKCHFALSAALYLALLAFVPGVATSAEDDPVIRISEHDVGGVVRSPQGPEAGVWVIAETEDLPTKFAKMVVTDDQGRYMLPELPNARYKIWVRGYGLVDSPKLEARPGTRLDLTAGPAPDDKAAAEYFPAIYWYSMLGIPKPEEFPGTGEGGNGIPPSIKNQSQWLEVVKTDGCYTCHQLGNKATRTIPEMIRKQTRNSVEAWERRIQSGQAMNWMAFMISPLNGKRVFKEFADWTDSIDKGALPFDKPHRPQGLERNVVITAWDYSRPTAYMHDAISTDKRDPTINANGKIYGSPEESTDYVPVLDPLTHTASEIRLPVRDPDTPTTRDYPGKPSPYWGDEKIWDSRSNSHNPMFDGKGRVWFTAAVGAPKNPDFCRKGSSHPSAQVMPLEEASRHLTIYDPATGKFSMVRTCFATHHLNFSLDGKDRLWVSSGFPQPGAIGWLDTKVLEETGDEQKAQGWTPIVLDTNGDGKRGDYVEPGEPIDPAKDKRIVAGIYGVSVNPKDGTLWGTSLGFPGYLVRLDPGSDPTHTALAEVYAPPFDDAKGPQSGFSPRGFDMDGNGVAWMPLASGHMASFDRSKCKGPLNGPKATGGHCPEGWTLYPLPGPQFKDVEGTGSAEASYYGWVDVHDTFGLGKNTPFVMGNANDSIIALHDGKMLNFVMPYPMGLYVKGIDGRIDAADAGWKGRGIWTTSGNRTPFHIEGGKGTRPKVVKFQLRPDPLAN